MLERILNVIKRNSLTIILLVAAISCFVMAIAFHIGSHPRNKTKRQLLVKRFLFSGSVITVMAFTWWVYSYHQSSLVAQRHRLQVLHTAYVDATGSRDNNVVKTTRTNYIQAVKAATRPNRKYALSEAVKTFITSGDTEAINQLRPSIQRQMPNQDQDTRKRVVDAYIHQSRLKKRSSEVRRKQQLDKKFSNLSIASKITYGVNKLFGSEDQDDLKRRLIELQQDRLY